MKFLAIATALIGFVAASPLVIKEHVDVPKEWELVRPAPEDHIIEVRIGLKQSNFDKLEEALYMMSHPDSHRYGDHMTQEQVHELIAPHPDAVSDVQEWLAQHNLEGGFSPAQDWVAINVPVAQANELLGTKYHVYRHAQSGREIVRTNEYSVPQHLDEHIDLVAPTTYFGAMHSLSAIPNSAFQPFAHKASPDASPSGAAKVNASCAAVITPDCLMNLYQTKGYKTKATKKNALGLAGYLEQYANKKDLQQFFTTLDKPDVNSSFKFVGINGGINPQTQADAGVEANLDVQYGRAISAKTPTTYYVTGGRPPIQPPDTNGSGNTNEPYLDFLNYILKQKTIPQTFSTSYGDDERTVPFSYASRVCKEFAQLGARGVSVIFSSGDAGVSSFNCSKPNAPFAPAFPAGCPYVTAVGATESVNPEVAVSTAIAGFYSGGGFSNYFKQPSYQKSAVTAYLKKLGTQNKGQYNKTGRGYPDVAAQGSNFEIVYQGQTGLVGGTSASSPTFAAVISLVNDYLLSKGKKPMGFLNPFLYAGGYKALTDITTGSNPGCQTTDAGYATNKGFPVEKGWDPVTGFGTPLLPKLQAAAENAQSKKTKRGHGRK